MSGWSGVFNPVCWLLLVSITETFVGVSGPRCRRCCFKYFRSPAPSLRLRTCSDAVKDMFSMAATLQQNISTRYIYSSLKHHSCHEVSHMFPANFHFHSFVANKKTGSAWVCPNRTRQGEATGRFSLHVARPYFFWGEWFPVVFFRCGTWHLLNRLFFFFGFWGVFDDYY